jgi:hypothetical protein
MKKIKFGDVVWWEPELWESEEWELMVRGPLNVEIRVDNLIDAPGPCAVVYGVPINHDAGFRPGKWGIASFVFPEDMPKEDYTRAAQAFLEVVRIRTGLNE